ncbi:hypothetical protein AURDEDRAFT_184751 [Auricularia subglabra TFB-10046 SS5]|nr:hypothetical protein AURDEDRAFT_184751 [Auricularia subglabra TFB-10046 SS5]
MESFDKTPLNSVQRRKDRAHYDVATIAAIIKEAKILHMSFVDDHGQPQCVPMLGAFEQVDSGECFIYFHGWVGARFAKAVADPSTPLVASATLFDGYVLALSVFHHSMNYRSAVCHGVSAPFTKGELDAGAKERALKLVVESAIPGRWDNARQPTRDEVNDTSVVRMRVESASAKIRTGPPKDDKEDVENTELVDRVWTGVVPSSRVNAAPEPSEYCRVQAIPDHVQDLGN